MAVIRITNTEQRAALVNALANDVIHARFYFNLVVTLTAEFERDPMQVTR